MPENIRTRCEFRLNNTAVGGLQRYEAGEFDFFVTGMTERNEILFELKGSSILSLSEL